MLQSSIDSSSVTNNQLFLGGIGLYGVAIGAFALRYLGRHVFSNLQRMCVVSLEVSSRDVSHRWLMQWIVAEGLVKSRQISVSSTNAEILANDTHRSDSLFIPAPNVVHLFVHQNRLFSLKRNKPTERSILADSHCELPETLKISMIGRDTAPLREIFRKAQEYVAKIEQNKTVLYNCAGSRWIRLAEPRRMRSLESVVLRSDLMERIITDLSNFFASEKWYHDMGIPFRRGYLLYGPPGCGKSSLVMAAAGKFSLAICMINLSNRSLDDDSLNQLLNSAPKKCAVLLEDIDLAFHQESRITASGLLNALDGVTAQEGRVVFMTTNNVNKLSKALVRPGRIDVRLFLGHADYSQIKRMFLRFFPKEIIAAEKFADTLVRASKSAECGGISTAEIQGFLFHHRESAEKAQQSAEGFFSESAT
uniref:Mitochondrial chaperone BCS1 n=1 Tax=Paramoeba aestuarina TaxID=180227 RepID=A0A7S4KF36_9EUKA|mmetsp:Transcript_17986/g.28143  ORF Transcript_17986/g.28143 Transcript_17986/m.28143 type:complete len:421 (+) Transcript_17986:58-1320(+)